MNDTLTELTMLGSSRPYEVEVISVESGLVEVPSPVFRPIQYLGSKLRSIDLLLDATNHLYQTGDRVFDVFSGSTVVSQAFSNAGCAVTAVDASPCCARLARALLSIDRSTGSRSMPHASMVVKEASDALINPELKVLAQAERKAMQDPSGHDLAKFSRDVPQVWRKSKGKKWLEGIDKVAGKNAFCRVPIVTTHYAGTYFGVQQAIAIDAIRTEIERLRRADAISAWIEDALVSALFSAMSRAVFSAGKHFAQPMIESPGRNDAFYRSRLLADRSVDIASAFVSAADSIDAAAKHGNHAVYGDPVEDIYDKLLSAKPVMVYADPPYTAQQYSRFYHVLDVVADYRTPQLQMANGKVTKGLYGQNRYKSPYSSKRSAAGAFEQLVETAKIAGSSLAISYSLTAAGNTGNARMISLEGLKAICKRQYGRKVKEIRLGHAYRQFNSARNSKNDRNEPEVLIICEA
ncbi:DNA adenine methylase [Pseudoxanthomonas mexicana]